MDRKPYTFLKPYRGYNAGECAGFGASAGAALVKAGIAREGQARDKGKAKAEKPEAKAEKPEPVKADTPAPDGAGAPPVQGAKG